MFYLTLDFTFNQYAFSISKMPAWLTLNPPARIMRPAPGLLLPLQENTTSTAASLICGHPLSIPLLRVHHAVAVSVAMLFPSQIS